MDIDRILKELCLQTDSKIVLLVLDGLGDLPIEGRTPLEAAATPHLDRLAAEGACGLTDPVSRGITPGSGPSHLALFGYDPTAYQLGRGILEALGVNVLNGTFRSISCIFLSVLLGSICIVLLHFNLIIPILILSILHGLITHMLWDELGSGKMQIGSRMD